jgi:hypothetical protein
MLILSYFLSVLYVCMYVFRGWVGATLVEASFVFCLYFCFGARLRGFFFGVRFIIYYSFHFEIEWRSSREFVDFLV